MNFILVFRSSVSYWSAMLELILVVVFFLKVICVSIGSTLVYGITIESCYTFTFSSLPMETKVMIVPWEWVWWGLFRETTGCFYTRPFLSFGILTLSFRLVRFMLPSKWTYATVFYCSCIYIFFCGPYSMMFNFSIFFCSAGSDTFCLWYFLYLSKFLCKFLSFFSFKDSTERLPKSLLFKS